MGKKPGGVLKKKNENIQYELWGKKPKPSKKVNQWHPWGGGRGPPSESSELKVLKKKKVKVINWGGGVGGFHQEVGNPPHKVSRNPKRVGGGGGCKK